MPLRRTDVTRFIRALMALVVVAAGAAMPRAGSRFIRRTAFGGR
jgi:hypothetical protein